jgi:hypothetical protein
MSFVLNRFMKLRERIFYHGNPIGLNTSGHYKDHLAKPAPLYYILTQGPVDGKILGFFAFNFFILCTFWTGPFFLAPFFKDNRKEAIEKYGPTHYGKSVKDVV